MEVTISGKICGIMPKRSGIGKNGKEWESQYFVIAINDDEENKFAFQVFGKDRLDELSLMNGMRVAVTLDITQSRGNDGAFYTNVFAKNVFVLPKKNYNGNSYSGNNNKNNQRIDDII